MSDMGVGLTGDPMVDSILTGGSIEAQEDPKILGGFYGGESAFLGTIAPDWAQNAGYGRPAMIDPGSPMYVEGDQYDLLRSLPLEQRVLLQEQLVALGLASSVVPGEYDDNTLNGMKSLLALANRQGQRYSETLQQLTRLKQQGALEDDVADFDPRPFLKPDYDTISQKVKQTFRDELGRDPDLYELQQLAGELTGFHQLEQEALEEFDLLQHEAANTPGSQPAETVEVADPAASFQELFERKYKHELDYVEDKAQAQVSRQTVESGVNTLDSMIDRTRT